MKLLIVLAACVLLLTGCRAPGKDEKQMTYQRISMQEAAEWMETEEHFVLVDVRTAQEYALGHIPGAVLLPNEEIGDEVVDVLPDKDALTLVYCRSGNRSRQAADKLVQLGYTNIVEIGGIMHWTGELER